MHKESWDFNISSKVSDWVLLRAHFRGYVVSLLASGCTKFGVDNNKETVENNVCLFTLLYIIWRISIYSVTKQKTSVFQFMKAILIKLEYNYTNLVLKIEPVRNIGKERIPNQ